MEVFEHIAGIKDPEHPYSLEELNVVEEGLVEVDDAAGTVRCVMSMLLAALHCYGPATLASSGGY